MLLRTLFSLSNTFFYKINTDCHTLRVKISVFDGFSNVKWQDIGIALASNVKNGFTLYQKLNLF